MTSFTSRLDASDLPELTTRTRAVAQAPASPLAATPAAVAAASAVITGAVVAYAVEETVGN